MTIAPESAITRCIIGGSLLTLGLVISLTLKEVRFLARHIQLRRSHMHTIKVPGSLDCVCEHFEQEDIGYTFTCPEHGTKTIPV